MMKRILFALIIVFSIAGCTNAIYQGRGSFQDEMGNSRTVLLQWKAQKYYIPFIKKDVDYGSLSLQAECIDNLLLDYENNKEYGLVFKERPQFYKLIEGAPNIRLGNFIVCAKLNDNRRLGELHENDLTRLGVFCEAKPGEPAILPPNIEGYPLQIAEGDKEITLICEP